MRAKYDSEQEDDINIRTVWFAVYASKVGVYVCVCDVFEWFQLNITTSNDPQSHRIG